MKHLFNNTYNQGQTIITLLIFMVVAITVTSASIILGISNSQATSKQELGLMTYQIAESGMENTLLMLLRNPAYSGETLTVGSGTAISTVSGSLQKIATTEGRMNSYVKKIEVIVDYSNNTMNIVSWKEIF